MQFVSRLFFIFIEYLILFMAKNFKPNNNKTVSAAASPAKARTSVVTPEKPFELSGFILLPIVLAFTCLTYSRHVIESTNSPRLLWQAGFTTMAALYLILVHKRIQISFSKPINIALICLSALSVWSILGVSFSMYWLTGLCEIIHYFFNVAFYIVVLNFLFLYPKLTEQFTVVFCVLSIFTAVIGLKEFFDEPFSFVPMTIDPLMRPIGVHGNRNLMGSFTALLLIFPIYLFIKKEGVYRLLAIVALILNVLILVCALTRTAWITTIISIFFVNVLLFIFQREYIKRSLIISLLFFGLFVISFPIAVKLQKNPEMTKMLKIKANTFGNFYEIPVDPFSKITASYDQTSGRTDIWARTIPVTLVKPLIGVGLNHWPIHVLDADNSKTSWEQGHVVPDRPHNVFLEIAAESGYVGLLFYIGFFLIVTYTWFVNLRKENSNKLLSILSMVGIITYSIDSIASFPNERLEHVMVMFLFTMLIFYTNISDPKEVIAQKEKTPVYASWILLVICGFTVFFFYNKKEAEMQYAMGKDYNAMKAIPQSMEALDKAKNIYFPIDQNTNPIENMQLVNYLELKNYDMARKTYFEGLRKNPNSAMLHSNMAATFMSEQKFDSAMVYYNKAFKIAPRFRQALMATSSYYSMKGDHTTALKQLAKLDTSFNLYMDMANVHGNAMVTYFNQKKYDSVAVAYNMFPKYKQLAKQQEIVSLMNQIGQPIKDNPLVNKK
jgi:O-antigen ligase